MSNKLALIHGLFPEEVSAVAAEIGVAKYRSAQIWDWLYRKYAASWADMKNIPLTLQDQLASTFSIDSALPNNNPAITFDGKQTTKLLMKLPDGDSVETVIIPSKERRTICVSCQVGCKFKCAFCASGQAGFRRNLEVGEIVGQVVAAARIIGGKPSNIVFMGMGEPFDNYDAVLKAARIMNQKDGLNIGARHITISTSGVIAGIKRLATEGIQFELSVSLHSADNAIRSKLMPVNSVYPLEDLIRACGQYTEATNRVITFEYTLISNVNDSAADIHKLIKLLSPLKCKINLLTLNAVKEFSGTPSDITRARNILGSLVESGITTTLRLSKGDSINAACGQLRFADN